MTSLARLLGRLTTPLDADAYLSLVNPRWGTRLRGVIERVSPVTDSAATVSIRPGVRWGGHRPGQFVTVGVDVDGVRHQRCYSLTSLPSTRGLIDITVQAHEGGTVSTHLVHDARPGDVVQLSQADGDFTLPDRIPDRLLFVTGGSGITPIIGMLRWLATQGRRPDTVLLHHATAAQRCLFLDELDEMGRAQDWLRVTTTFTGEPGGRRLDGRRLDELCTDWRDRDAYVCGPTTLLDVAADNWDAAGRLDQLHVERFTPDLLLPPHDDRAGTSVARFAASDVDVLADPGTPLLEVAEDAGLTPPAGCRMGICRTCSTRLEQGCVRDLRDGRILSAGQHVQLCVSAAAGDVVLDR